MPGPYKHPLLAGEPGSTHLLLGNEAIVRGAIEAGVAFVSCYPGTPSSEVPDTFFRLHEEAGISFEYSVNEKVALEVAAGATIAGALCLVTMKHVGVNVAADPLLTLTGISSPGGLVLLSADDPGCHSSQNEQDNRLFARLAGLPTFEPSTAQECKDYAREALLYSRKMQTPVLLRTTTRVNHIRGPVTFGEVLPKAEILPYHRDPKRFLPIPAFAPAQHKALIERLDQAFEDAEASELNVVEGEGIKLGVIASGIARSYAADALVGAPFANDVSIFHLGMSYPLPAASLADFMDQMDAVLVAEEIEDLVETELRAIAQRMGNDTPIYGKSEILPKYGEYSVFMLRRAMADILGVDLPIDVSCVPEVSQLPGRPPNLCAGCPHRASFYNMKEVFGDDAIYANDIGCYTLGLLPPFNAADFILCMGASISAGSGFSHVSGKTVVSVIGDSTFFHSGITGVINAVYNGHDLVVVIVDNHTTAMTGQQPHAGVPESVKGPNPRRVDLETVVRGLGADLVVKAKALNRKASMEALLAARDTKGVRVVILEDPCVIHTRRTGGPAKTQTAYAPEPHEDLIALQEGLACPAMHREEGRLVVVEELCAGCMYCLQLSPHMKAKKRGVK